MWAFSESLVQAACSHNILVALYSKFWLHIFIILQQNLQLHWLTYVNDENQVQGSLN